MSELVQLIANGLVTGAILALGAIGISFIYGILRIVNFAHGDYLTFGAYMAFIANVSWGQHILVAAIFAMIATAALGQAFEVVLWRPMRNRSAGVLRMFVVSTGLALILRNMIGFVWGSQVRAYTLDLYQVYDFGILRLSLVQIVVISTASTILLLLGFFLGHTTLGKSMRALADNPSLAAVAGVDVSRITAYTWIMGSAMAGLAGVLQAILQSPFTPAVGFRLLLPMFAAVVLGGIGNAYGTLVGGMVLGVAMETSTWSGYAGGISAVYKPVVAFVVLVLVLLFRPQGVFGRARVL